MKDKKGALPLLTLLVFAGIVFGVIWAVNNIGGDSGTLSVTGGQDASDDVGKLQTNIGEAATMMFNAYSGPWGGATSETEVFPVYTIVRDGEKIVSDSGANSTTQISVGQEVDIYTTGTNYLLYPGAKNCGASSATPLCRLEVYDVPETTDMVISVRDENDDALTADDADNNSADYAGGDLAADAEYTYYVKFQNSGSDENFVLGALCTHYAKGQEVDDFEFDGIDDSKDSKDMISFSEVAIPKALKDATAEYSDDTNAENQTVTFAHCYKPSKPIDLAENQWITGAFVIDTDDTTQTSANGDAFVGVSFFDYHCSTDRSGKPVCDWVVMGDGTEDPGAIGIDENAENVLNGLDIAVTIEPQ